MKKFLVLCFVVISFVSKAQDKITLELNVFNEFSNENISFADVKMVNTTTNQKIERKTNFNGNILIDLYPNMNYQLFVSIASDSNIVIFKEKTLNFSTENIEIGNKINYDVKLRPIFQKGGLQNIKDIYFEIFSYTLDKESEIVLENILELMRKHPEIQLEVHGFASCNLTENDANSVSVERATAVFSYLTNAGIDYQRLKAVAWGKEKNVAKCTCEIEKSKDKPCTKSDHLKNSRVSLTFTGF